ncbi:hypothetical protein [Pigmentibacter ruber]|uniref:hypothetical protein n=1 Tax=Pigmentibacter ruber TaxID=2683196 RepID=UPI00131AE246|nr:hypothetical protein [Pigmentibacter ruber]
MLSNVEMFLTPFENQSITQTCMVYNYIELFCDEISISIFNKFSIKDKENNIVNLFDIHGKVIKKIEIDEILKLFQIYIFNDIILSVDFSSKSSNSLYAINIVLKNSESIAF